jgi:hypothetical protein
LAIVTKQLEPGSAGGSYYNPSYSGGRDQEDHGWKPAQANSSLGPYLKKPFTKIGLMEWLKVKALSSNPSTAKKKKKQLVFSCSFVGILFLKLTFISWIK